MGEDMSRVIVDVTNVSKHYGEGDARVDALKGVDLAVHAGEVVALLGPSGSGKTTLLNIIGCIIDPSAGKVMLDDELVYDNRWLRGDLRKLTARQDRVHLSVPQPAAVSRCQGQRGVGVETGWKIHSRGATARP